MLAREGTNRPARLASSRSGHDEKAALLPPVAPLGAEGASRAHLLRMSGLRQIPRSHPGQPADLLVLRLNRVGGSVGCLADEVDYVIGVDTHRDQHTLAVVSAPTGAVLAQTEVRASARGYADALRFAERHARGVRAWAVEGAGHYGAGLTRYLGER